MMGAVLLVIPLAFTYVRTRTRVKFDHSLVQTVIVLPIVVTAILVVVRDSLALAFSLAGIVAAVRFRNNLRESGDAVYIFGAIGIGFASGIHALSVAAVLSIVLRGGRAGPLEVQLQRRISSGPSPDCVCPRAPTWPGCRSRARAPRDPKPAAASRRQTARARGSGSTWTGWRRRGR